MTPRWEHFEHGADIGIRGIASSPGEAFAQTAVALTAVITNPELVSPEQCVDITCEAPDLELLLLDWINDLIYQMAVRRMLFGRYQVVIEKNRLQAQAFGETIDRKKHQPGVEIKGATFTELRVYRNSGHLWIAQCVVDV